MGNLGEMRMKSSTDPIALHQGGFATWPMVLCKMLMLGEAGGGVYRKFLYCLCNYSHFTAVSGRVSSHTQVCLKSVCLASDGGLGTSLRPGRRRSWEGTRPSIAGGGQVEREGVYIQHLRGSGRLFPSGGSLLQTHALSPAGGLT